MTDVQGHRLEYGVYAWSRGLLHGWHIDGGVIAGDPSTDAPWLDLEKILARTYEDGRGNAWDIDAFGVDAGYLSNRVYLWARKHSLPRSAPEPHKPPATRHVFALDGRPGWRLPALGMPSVRDIDFGGKKVGETRLWPTGTFDLKSETYAALRNTIVGQDRETGAWSTPVLHFGQQTDLAFFEQLTAEHLVDRDAGCLASAFQVMYVVSHNGEYILISANRYKSRQTNSRINPTGLGVY
jgi:phage terminase large subunit GpA-like protein